jgi:hypothetical protein
VRLGGTVSAFSVSALGRSWVVGQASPVPWPVAWFRAAPGSCSGPAASSRALFVNDRPVSFKMPAKLHAQIAKLAEADHRSVSNYLVKIAAEHVAVVAATKKTSK